MTGVLGNTYCAKGLWTANDFFLNCEIEGHFYLLFVFYCILKFLYNEYNFDIKNDHD